MKKKKPLTGKIKKYTPKSAFGISKLKNAKKM